MVEPEITGELNPDNDEIDGLETAYDIAQQETQEQIMDMMEAEGYDPDEIEALFDPAPRRHRRHRRSHRVAYDPAPRRRRRGGRKAKRSVTARRSGHRGKGALGGLLNYAGIIAGGAKFLMDYQARAAALGTNPATGAPYNILTAIEYDMKNFDSAAAMTRLQAAAPTIIVEGVGGYIAKSSKVNSMLKGYGKPAGDALIGVAVATALKAFLDPPVNAVRAPMIQPTRQVAQMQIETGGVPVVRQ